MTKTIYHSQRGVGTWVRGIPLIASLVLTLLIQFTATTVRAQNRIMTGKVTSVEDNTPLPGVNVLIRGTSIGTTTDADGNYRLGIRDDNDVLVFSFIGFATEEIIAGSRSLLDVTMSQDITQLSEVVITALGISQEKKGLGYSVQEVKGKELVQTQRPNFLMSLQGRVAGLTMTPTSGLPGASASINLRGMSSIAGSNQPLIVVDGLVVNNSTFNQHALVSDLDNRFNDYQNRGGDLNPNDIESITVLKGPEASALYGQDGGSGVIVITTKKGSAGVGKISYDNAFSFQKVYLFPDVQRTYGRGTNGVIDAASLGYFGPKYADSTVFFDNKNSFFETGRSQNHNLVFEGGTEKVSYFLSTNYLDQKGTVPSSHFKRISIRLNSSAKISEKFNASTSFNYTYSNNIKPIRGEYGFLLGVLSWPSNDDMSSYLNPDGSRRWLTTSTNTEVDNPFFSINKNSNTDKINRIIGNVSLTYNPVLWLSFVSRVGTDVYSTIGNYFLHPQSYSGTTARFGGLITNGSIDNYTDNYRLINGTFLGTAKKDFNKFKTSLMLGYAFDDSRSEVNSLKGEQLLLKDFNSINNTTATTQRTKNTVNSKRVISTLGNFTLSYSDLAYLTVTGRNDWSSSLEKEFRSFFYPSVSFSFVFSELEAVQNFSALSFGKIRASYAEIGKDAPAYATRSRLDVRTSTGGGFAYGFFGGNLALKPERGEGYELGTEFKFFQNRIGVDFSVYKNDRFNQIVPGQRLSYATGFVLMTLNGGDFSNRGVELQLSGVPIEANNLKWDVLLNFTKSRTKILSVPAPTVVYEYYNSDTWMYGNARGSAFTSDIQRFFPTANLSFNQDGAGSATAIGGYSYLRNNNGDVLIDPASGLPLVNNNFLPIGDRNPDFMIGLTNSFTYMSLSLSFLLDIRKGGDVFNGNELYLFRNGLSKLELDRETPRVFNGVLRDGNENSTNPTRNTIQLLPYTLGSAYYNAFPESEFVEHDINWLRLRDITINYQVPSSLLSSQRAIKSAGLFITMTDVFLITNYTGADPGVNGTTPATGGSGAFGFDFGSLAPPRTISMGIRISL